MTTQELVTIYYKGYAQKHGWETVIADDFKFTGGDMTKTTPVTGMQAYVEISNRFNQWFTDMRPLKIFISDNEAFVLANYDLVYPNNRKVNANVAKLWKVENGKLSSLTIFFDTANFNAFLKG
jgi:ketosteroid isomerase-like protein